MCANFWNFHNYANVDVNFCVDFQEQNLLRQKYKGYWVLIYVVLEKIHLKSEAKVSSLL